MVMSEEYNFVLISGCVYSECGEILLGSALRLYDTIVVREWGNVPFNTQYAYDN